MTSLHTHVCLLQTEMLACDSATLMVQLNIRLLLEVRS